MDHRTTSRRPHFLALVALIYAMSFLLPALGDLPGWAAFVWGLPCCVMAPFTVLASGTPGNQLTARDWQWCLLALAWAANPLAWIGYGFLARGAVSWARGLGVVALALASSVILTAGGGRAGGLGPGYWLWIASIALLVCGGCFSEERRKPRWFPSDEFIREALRHVGTTDAPPGPADDRVRPTRKYEYVCDGAGEQHGE